MKTRPILFGFLLLMNGCVAQRQTILTVPAVSMTRPSMSEGYVARPGEKVSAEYCRGDDPLVSQDRNIGLIDEAIMKAQKQSNAEYLSDVTISQAGQCIMVEGTAMH